MARILALTFAVVLVAASASATPVRLELWGENAVGGSASEGTHAWITRGLYERGRELGLDGASSATLSLGVMAAWEIYEVETLDAEGMSVQDMVANAAGVLSGLAGLDMHYSYATYRVPARDPDHPWLNVPLTPRNDLSYAIEVGRDGWSFGYKYLGAPGDFIIGTTSMPVMAGDWGKQKVVGYVGRSWKSGWHAAAGYDGHGELTVGGGYCLMFHALGFDLTSLVDGDDFGWGLSCFAAYDRVF
jgi:hypothetical protein